MPAPDSSSDYDVSPRLLAVARALGMGEIPARWKIIRVQRWWRRLRQDLAPASRRFDRQICQSCGTLQATSIATCGACGKRVGSRAGALLRSFGLSIPTALSVSSALGVAMVAIYGRMILARPGQGIFSWDITTLIEFGADYPPGIHAGQWWRLGTAIFLHIGLWHIAFNLLALAQIGPSIEEIFGRGRMLFFFLLTGVLANIGSGALGTYSASAGASGAIMGLIGIAAGWGQRVGTARGRDVRNQMLKWAAYTMGFGYFIHANNWAHGFGFASGAILGFVFNPYRLQSSKAGTANAVLGAVGIVVTAGILVLCIKPPASSRALAASLSAARDAEADDDASDDDDMDGLGEDWVNVSAPACALLEQGKTAEALERIHLDMRTGDAARGIDRELAGICAARREALVMCKQLSTEGAAALGSEMDPRVREKAYETYRKMCAGVKTTP